MKKFFFISIVAVVALIMGYNVYISHGINCLSDIVLANVEALANSESGSDKTTWQEGDKTIVSTSSPGWTFDLKLNVWLFEGKVSNSTPPSIETVKIKCCRLKGPLASCSYEEC